MDEFNQVYLELHSSYYSESEGTPLRNLIELCGVMVEKNYPLIHDTFGYNLPQLHLEAIKGNEDVDLHTLLENLLDVWSEWSQFEG